MLLNIIFFYIGWWGIALLASKSFNLLIIGFSIIMIGIHIFINRNQFLKEMLTLASIASVGILFDLALNLYGIFSLQKYFSSWLPCIWIIFACTFRHSMKKVLSLPNIYIFFLSAIGGPLSYYLVTKLDLIIYQIDYQNIVIHFFAWGFLMLVLKKITWSIDESTKFENIKNENN